MGDKLLIYSVFVEMDIFDTPVNGYVGIDLTKAVEVAQKKRNQKSESYIDVWVDGKCIDNQELDYYIDNLIAGVATTENANTTILKFIP